MHIHEELGVPASHFWRSRRDPAALTPTIGPLNATGDAFETVASAGTGSTDLAEGTSGYNLRINPLGDFRNGPNVPAHLKFIC